MRLTRPCRSQEGPFPFLHSRRHGASAHGEKATRREAIDVAAPNSIARRFVMTPSAVTNCLVAAAMCVVLFGVPGVSRAQSNDDWPAFENSPADFLASQPPWVELKWQRGELWVDFRRALEYHKPLITACMSEFKARRQRQSASGDKWMNGFESESIEFTVSYGLFPRDPVRPVRKSALTLSYNQVAPVHDRMAARFGSKGAIEFEWTRHGDDFLCRMQQHDSGRVEVTLIHEGRVVYLIEQDLWTLCTRHAELFESRIAPLLGRCGIRPPLTPESPQVVEALLERLKPVDPDRLSRFMELLDKLNDEDFDVREATTGALAENFGQWKDLIAQYANDPSLSLECRTRLKALLDERSGTPAGQAGEVVDVAGLVNDASYLRRVLYKLSQNGDRQAEYVPRVVRRLEEIRGTSLSPQDIAAIVESEKKRATAPLSSDLIDEVVTGLNEPDGPLHSVVAEVQDLVPLAFVSGKLVFDREYWRELFNGRSVLETLDQVRELMEQNRLPQSWFQPGGPYLLETLGYPQLLFERLCDVIVAQEETGDEKRPNSAASFVKRIAAHSRNRELSRTDFFARLLVHPEPLSSQRTAMVRMGQVLQAGTREPLPVPDAQFFLLHLKERKASDRELRVFAGPDGRVSVTLLHPAEAQMIHLAQSPDSGPLSLTVWSSGKSLRRSAGDLEDLVKIVGPKEWQLLESGLARFGISIQNSLKR